MVRGVGRNFSRGVVLNGIFQKKVSFCTDFIFNVLYSKCKQFAPPPIFLRPCRPIPAYSFLAQCIDSRAYAVLLLALSDTEIIRNTRGTFGQVCTGRARRPGVA